MVNVYMCTLSQAACMMKQLLHDCGIRALHSGTRRLHVEIEWPLLWTQAKSGAVRSTSGFFRTGIFDDTRQIQSKMRTTELSP